MTNFKDLALNPKILQAIADLGYEQATPIQAETIPLLIEGDTDFLGLAATGTGKTAAFSIPLLNRIKREQKGVQALVLCPTRELAIQVAGQIDLLGKHMGIRSLPIYGGTGYGDQIYGLKNGANIVVGTPGRVIDHIDKGTLQLGNLKTLVLDEADEMISMGFKDDLEAVLKAAPKDQANIWLFSATMGHEVKHVADAYLKNPKRVQINKTEMLSTTVEQIFYKIHEYDKMDLLSRIIDAADDFYGIVFCQTKALVNDVQQFLKDNGYQADCLHGDLDQAARDRVMKSFRNRNISILVATDVACRGLDVKDVSHVVNYSIPRELDNYVHRIGRTARSGKTGLAISFVTYSHRDLIGRIERMTKSRMKEGVAPTKQDIALKRVKKVWAAFEAGPQGRATAMIPEDWKTALAEMNQADIAGRFLALMMPDLFPASKKEASKEKKQELPKPREQEPQQALKLEVQTELQSEATAAEMQDSPAEEAPRPSKPSSAGFREKFDKPRFEKSRFDKPRSEKRGFDKPRFERGDKPRFERSEKPRFEKPRFEKRRFDGPKFDGPKFGRSKFEGQRFEKKFESPERADRTPPWERGEQAERSAKPARSGPPYASPGTSAVARPKPRWKNNFQAPAAAEAPAKELGGNGKIKKKPFGHWKSKKPDSII